MISILHQDDDYVVVDKPARRAVHRGPHARRDETFVLQDLAAQIGKSVWPVHRLDRASSGVLVFACSRAAIEPMAQALRDPGATKDYLVLARGVPPPWFECRRPLTNTNGRRVACSSVCRRLAAWEDCALLEVRIRTGRTHQIRRHLSHLAHHVAGDTTHGKGWFNRRLRERCGLQRQFLHAWRTALIDPRDGSARAWEAPLPDELGQVLVGLGDGEGSAALPFALSRS